MIYRVPVYLYIENKAQNVPATLMYYEDNAVIEKYHDTRLEYRLRNADISLSELYTKVNQVAMFPLLNNLYQFTTYQNASATDKRSIYPYEQDIINALNLSVQNIYITDLPVISSGAYNLEHIWTVNNVDLVISSGSLRSYLYTVSKANTYPILSEFGNYATTLVGLSSNLQYNRFNLYRAAPDARNVTFTYKLVVFPENLFDETGVIEFTADNRPVCFTVIAEIDIDPFTNEYTVTDIMMYSDIWNEAECDLFTAMYEGFTTEGDAGSEEDTDNPYGLGGQSGIGGGDGIYGDIDSVDGAGIPDLPDISAADLGFITMYNPTKIQLKDLADFMWSSVFDLDTYKKLFSDPMQSIIGLAIVPVAPTTGGSKEVTFGTIGSGVSMPVISTQYKQLDCGWIDIDKYVGSFMDYSPYTKISLYLPYIGIHEISPDDVMGDSIRVVYNIDVLSGACGAFVQSGKKGVLYSYNGSCISNIPLTSINFSSAIQNAVSAVCSGAGIIAGMATGAAPVTAMGIAGLLGSAANTAINSKPSVQRSGSLGGSAGVLSIQKPYVIIERPNLSVPSFVNKFVGNCSNITMYLNDCHGFTMVEYIHLHDIPATDEEIQEIEALLKEGVIL